VLRCRTTRPERGVTPRGDNHGQWGIKGVILDKDSGDCPQYPALMQSTAQRFTVKEVSADKAYLSVENTEMTYEIGAEPFIMSKVQPDRRGGQAVREDGCVLPVSAADFLDHYHKRSNVESTFSACKRKFGDSVLEQDRRGDGQ
jgi:transposase